MSPLNPDIKVSFKDTLTNAAIELTIGESLPVDIEKICTKLQIEHDRNALDGKSTLLTGKSHIHLPSLLLPNSGYYGAVERYRIAHEIGHFILVSRCSAAPSGKSEYWQFEDLCNNFARQLLFPEKLLANLLTPISSTEAALELSIKLADDGLVPWPTAALLMTEHYPGYVFLHVTYKINSLKQLNMKISSSTLLRKQHQGKLLNEDSRLAAVLEPLTKRGRFVSFCDTESERSDITTELPGLGKVSGVCGKRISGGGIALAFHQIQ